MKITRKRVLIAVVAVVILGTTQQNFENRQNAANIAACRAVLVMEAADQSLLTKASVDALIANITVPAEGAYSSIKDSANALREAVTAHDVHRGGVAIVDLGNACVNASHAVNSTRKNSYK